VTEPTTIIAGEAVPNLAIDVLPDNVPGTFLVDVAEVDGPELLGWGFDGWSNIVCDVQSVRMRRGGTRTQGPLVRTEAGSCAVRLEDTGRRFDPTANADAIHPGIPFRVRAWGTAPGVGDTESRRNRVPNPRVATANTSWSGATGLGGTATQARVATGGPAEVGPAFSRITWSVATTNAAGTGSQASIRADGRAASTLPIPVTAGEVLSGSIYVRSSVAQRFAAALWFYKADGTNTGLAPNSAVGAQVVVPANTWTRLTVANAVVPTGATHVMVVASTPNGTGAVPFPVGATLDGTGAQLEPGATVGPYFDGATPATGDADELGSLAYGWAGTAHASASIEYLRTETVEPWSSVLFVGRIGGDLRVEYQRIGPPLVSFTASDLIAQLARYSSVGRPDPGAGDGDTLLTRTRRVLDEAGLSTTLIALDSDTGYAATMPATSLANGWGDITAATDAELGRVWVNTADEVVVRSRGSLPTGPVRGTLSDWHGESADEGELHCCYSEAAVVYGVESLTTRAVGARRVPRTGDGTTPPVSAIVQLDDTYSTARYTGGTPAAYENRSLELQLDGQLTPWAEALLLRASRPELRVDSVTPVPPDEAAWRAVCLTDIGDRWLFRQHPQVGDTVATALGVFGIEHDITPDGWVVTFATERAPAPDASNPDGWVVVDLSDVDSDDVLAAFGGAVAP